MVHHLVVKLEESQVGLRYDQVLVVAWIADDCTLWLTGVIRRVAWKVVREGVGNTEDRSASGRADLQAHPIRFIQFRRLCRATTVHAVEFQGRRPP